jgi:hypothetical protein
MTQFGMDPFPDSWEKEDVVIEHQNETCRIPYSHTRGGWYLNEGWFWVKVQIEDDSLQVYRSIHTDPDELSRREAMQHVRAICSKVLDAVREVQ